MKLSPAIYILIIVLSLPCHKVFSQETKKDKRACVFKFSPLVLLEPVGGYQLGAEVPLIANISLQAEYAYLPFYRDFDLFDPQIFRKVEGFSAHAYKAEARIYFTDEMARSMKNPAYTAYDIQGFYFACQLQLKTIKMRDSSFSFSNQGTEPQFVSYTSRLKIIKNNAKIGYQRIYSNGFTADCYLGVGLRFADFSADATNVVIRTRFELDMPLNFTMGAKIGWAF